jgi:putative Mg2+ transporter-C (MgtC) family protein
MMDALGAELFGLPDMAQFIRVFVRLTAAVVLGGLLGYEREREGKAAGFRTHMLVALGAALFTVGPLEAGMVTGDLSRVFQGIVTGIGFIGAGTILKRTDEREIQGLTTAANLWFTAAVGMAVGLGHLWLPTLGVAFALLILTVLGYAERRIRRTP